MEKQIFTFLISDESLNDHGAIIKTQGIDIENFLKNPVALWNHDRQNVIGKWQNLRIIDNAMIADIDLDIESPFSQELYNKVKNGFIRACSIAMNVKQTNDIAGVIYITECELCEVSLVALPANNNAVKLSKPLKTQNNIVKSDNTTYLELQQLKQENENLTKKLAKENEHKIFQLVEGAFAQRKITAPQRGIYYELARKDFDLCEKMLKELKGYNSIMSQINVPKDFGIAGQLENNAPVVKKTILDKPKSEWTLQDYRKYAPKELENNEELLKELLSKKKTRK